MQLFNIQVINGNSFREQSEKRMLRTETVVAPRGEIYDRNGVVLATSKLSFNIELYKVRVEPKEQNLALAKLIEILDKNEDKIYSNFPINDELNALNFETPEQEKKWKKDNKIDENSDFDSVIDFFIKKYELEDVCNPINKTLQIKIIKIKYEGAQSAYSLFNSATIAKDISEKSVAQIEERKSELFGVNITSVPKRYYPNSNLTAHTVGYVNKVSDSEYEKIKEQGYNINSVIGKNGIEQSFETYLRGKDGVTKSETDIQGNISSEYISEEPISGKNVTLTLDYRLQQVAQDSLEMGINGLRNGTLVGKKIPDADAGSVVVLDVETGEVLAMANYPTYDTNKFVNGISTKDWLELTKDPVKPMYNRAIAGTYSPGSTYKMLVGIAGLKAGGMTVQEKIRDPGIYPYGHHPKCWIFSQYGITHRIC
ncbi:MAG: penicillin-binding transpeptidase domain-containing protein [Clostridia bacterium]